MIKLVTFVIALLFCWSTSSYNFDPAWTKYNLNTNQHAQTPLEYTGEWTGHQYQPSPKNWRFPFYSLFLDRFVNGDPTNDNINGTLFEHDLSSTQMRNGGDLQGLIDSLDYLHGTGIRAIYIAGSPFLNQPWSYDSYSPIDLSILDWHFGDIAKWREAVEEIHRRGMYVILDNTFATLSDLLGFEGYLNETTPFTLKEHRTEWKSERRYWDFEVSEQYNETCQYPRFWLETGYPVGADVTSQMQGCYAGDFDQYGDTEAFGVYPDWRRQLTKFASVQDRLREWHEPVRLKLENFYCMMIGQLDIDGYRYDKAMQSTVDAMGSMNAAMRACAKKYGKDNFFLAGEITGGNVAGSIYIGRGRQPNMKPENLTLAASLSNTSDAKYFIREDGLQALDSAAFHYTTYRTLTRFLGMDGNLEAGYDSPSNWVDQWNDFIMTNDLINANTGQWDPRHLFGVTNQDVFRWGAIKQGVQRQLLGHFITSILLPGIPLLLWGEEQAFYMLDNTATNYLFGRQPMSAALAWMEHGCYSFADPSTQYYQMPIDAAKHACNDESQMRDHRDPTHPVRNIVRHMYHLRESYPVLNDGMFLQQLSNMTNETTLPGSSGVITELGLWSVLRSQFPEIQDLSEEGGQGDTSVWLLYSNRNETTNYSFDCMNNATDMNTTALVAPYAAGTTVKNLFFPFEEIVLQTSAHQLGINGSSEANGCAATLEMPAYGFKAYVLADKWVQPKPMLTEFIPGHDARLVSSMGSSNSEEVEIEIHFSQDMDCDSVTESITFNSTTDSGQRPTILNGSVSCSPISANGTALPYVGLIPSVWSWKATLTDVESGVHALTLTSPLSASSSSSTNATERLIFRIGSLDNPVVFPRVANYSMNLLHNEGGQLKISHNAAGASLWRYSTNWGSSFSEWMAYTGGNATIERLPWTGTKQQSWQGDHVQVEYYSPLVGQSDIVQQGDALQRITSNSSQQQTIRRFPHLFWNGPYNQYGYDAGLDNAMLLTNNGSWEHYFLTEWMPSGVLAQVNIWGLNPDGKPDQSFVYGDIDQDSVLDRLPPSSLSGVSLNITAPPPKPFTGWKIVINDGTRKFQLVPAGNMIPQLIVYVLLWIVPVLCGGLSVMAYIHSFYGIKFNQIGITEKTSLAASLFGRTLFRRRYKEMKNPALDVQTLDADLNSSQAEKGGQRKSQFLTSWRKSRMTTFQQSTTDILQIKKRRKVLIATMEYDIEDWAIKVKIGGLGVMAQLMGKNLAHQDLIWVVPCVGGIDYPVDTEAEPMHIGIMGQRYEIKVQYHVLRNITYVLLDAPVFRAQTKAEPYPARMDDMPSAIYYSAWNQAIAHTINRFKVDLYHINDYHGALAPLYILPKTIPACLSLHNAEFQGLWPTRTRQELEEVCSVFNLPVPIVQKYVQFGEVFNLLHSGASILREQQAGFGAVGVSKKYGVRAMKRYAIFWGLQKIGALPNPDPSDTDAYNRSLDAQESNITVDSEYEASRGELRRQAQEWAGLDQDPEAELFVFVGRWSQQKGVDLIADVFSSVLEANPKVQLMTIGPVIDLYGKFAAAKLDKMAEVYPGRVFSKPVFTALPPFIFSGAEFALIPSRDEPFGLVAVEFGRKGALGVGARVGGLGQMPGWWYTVESSTTSHLTHQFRIAIQEALSTSKETRALMRARSAKQRFPVARWVEDLEVLQSSAIEMHNKICMSRHIPPLPIEHDSSRRTNLSSDSMEDVTSTDTVFSPYLATGKSVLSLTSLNDRVRVRADPAKAKKTHLSNVINVDDIAQASEGKSTSLTQSLSVSQSIEDHLRTTEDAVHRDSGESDTGSSPHEPILEAHAIGLAWTTPPDSPSHPTTPKHGRSGRLLSSFSSSCSSVVDSIELDFVPVSHDIGVRNEIYIPISPPSLQEQPAKPRAVSAILSVDSVVGEKKGFKLQKVDPSFTDSDGQCYREFEQKLQGLNGSNSAKTCIEEFLVKSEKKWFDNYRAAKLGRPQSGITIVRQESEDVISHYTPAPTPPRSANASTDVVNHIPDAAKEFDSLDQYLLGEDYTPPSGLLKAMQIKFFDWPLYSILLAFGQIISANSYQITLLTGTIGQSAGKLYTIASIYLVTSIMWWALFRRLPSRFCLSLPFGLYGLAFLFIGVAHFVPTYNSRGWVQNLGTACYACASSSGSLFFALNFGDEGGANTKVWIFRSCIIQGAQQSYVVALWAWGSYLSKRNMQGLLASEPVVNSWRIVAICIPVVCVLWTIGAMLWFGLPKYYRQHPGHIQSFYVGLMRRKIVQWFFVAVVVQNIFLSAPYGRNWSFLFNTTAAPVWTIVLLVFLFFVVMWSILLYGFARLTHSHSWILPLFAIGLGAPRWAQIWWGTSNIGLWLPWAPGPTAMSSALASRSVWLWLGTLDAIQAVGIGMILLMTLTRYHVACTLIIAQVLGSISTMLARAFAPNRIGPGSISPDITKGINEIGQSWFWIGLICNLGLCVGFFLFFRKEQMSKP